MTNKSNIKVILVDDHKIFRLGIKSLIELENIGEVIAEAKDGNDLLGLLDSKKPDIILMDISMPNMDGIEATKRAIEKNPNLNIPNKNRKRFLSPSSNFIKKR